MIGEDQGLSGAVDTIQQLRRHSERDTLVGQCVFAYYGTDHIVRAWRDDHYQPVDGGSFWLELDSMGAIYSHSTTWPGFVVIHTNNDSINELIAMAIGAASRPAHFGIKDPLPRTPSIETVQFTAVDSAVNWSP